MSAPPPAFARPDVRFHESWLEALREYHDEGRHDWLDEDIFEDRDEFARYCAARERRRGAARRARLLPGPTCTARPCPVSGSTATCRRPCSGGSAGDEYLGRLSIRHRLTPHLLYFGGNIGFEVRPGARRRGHATAMLAAALPLAAALGIDPARVDCDAGNVASRRVIERNGGVLDEERDGSLYFWVPTT